MCFLFLLPFPHFSVWPVPPVLPVPPSTEGAGTEFVLSFMQNYLTTYSRPKYQLFISAVEEKAKVTVRVPTTSFKVNRIASPGETIVITLPSSIELCASKKSFQTVLIDATAEVTVTSFSSKKWTADTSVVLPTTEWGTEYFILTPKGSPGGTFKEFSVTNGKEGNQVEIYPRGTIQFERGIYRAGSKLVVSLLPYETLQLQSTDDLTNTRVVSQRPVAVITGHTCTWFFSKCNHVYEQLLPVSKWGSSFIVPPVGYQTRYDSVYLQASQPTTITVNYGTTQGVVRLSRGQVHELRYKTPAALSIQADRGIQVLLLFNGLTMQGYRYFDPFLINVLSTDHFCSSYSHISLDGFDNQVLIVTKTDSVKKMKFAGRPIQSNQWSKVGGTDYSWIQMQMNHGRQSRILSSSGSPFGLYTFGVSQMNGYGSWGHCIKPGKAFQIFYLDFKF